MATDDKTIDAAAIADYWPPRRGGIAAEPSTFPACAGPCKQGRAICPCPEACRLESADMGVERDDLSCASGIVRAVIVSIALYAWLTVIYLLVTA